MRENEEIRGMNNKKDSKHQFGAFSQFSFGIGFREEKRTKRRKKESKQRKEKESKGSKDQARKGWIKHLQREFFQVTCCMYDFLAGFGMHGICMCVFGSFVVIDMGFFGYDNGFSLSLRFTDSHAVENTRNVKRHIR